MVYNELKYPNQTIDFETLFKFINIRKLYFLHLFGIAIDLNATCYLHVW